MRPLRPSVGASPVPAVVSRFAAGRPVRAVWVNELGGVTFRVGSGVEFIKADKAGVVDFADEARGCAGRRPILRCRGCWVSA